MKNKKRLIIMLLLSVLLGGCVAPNSSYIDTNTNHENFVQIQEYTGNSVWRFIDKEAGTVCWIYANYNKGGISCLPIKDTYLGNNK
jgi:hypothetical protein